MMTDREMVSSQNGTFAKFLYTFTINCVTTGERNLPIEYMFSSLFVVSNV